MTATLKVEDGRLLFHSSKHVPVVGLIEVKVEVKLAHAFTCVRASGLEHTLEVNSPAEGSVVYIQGALGDSLGLIEPIQLAIDIEIAVHTPSQPPEEAAFKEGWVLIRSGLERTWTPRHLRIVRAVEALPDEVTVQSVARLQAYSNDTDKFALFSVVIDKTTPFRIVHMPGEDDLGDDALELVSASQHQEFYVRQFYHVLVDWVANIKLHLYAIKPTSEAAAAPSMPQDKNPKYNFVSDFARRSIKSSVLCKMFCKGKKCKTEDFSQWLSVGHAIQGLYSNWVTEHLLATARPSDRLMDEYNIIGQFRSVGIFAVVNLQIEGEHASCGDGLVASGFSYTPERFMEAGVSCYNFRWADFGVPTLTALLDMVKILSSIIDSHGKVAVHCHSGLGRTGVLLAAYLIFARGLTANNAISFVRAHRRKAIQTKGQVRILSRFADFLKQSAFPSLKFEIAMSAHCLLACRDKTSFIPLPEYMRRQRVFLHGQDARTFRYLPKTLFLLCEGLLQGDVASVATTAWDDGVVDHLLEAASERKWADIKVETSSPDQYGALISFLSSFTPPIVLTAETWDSAKETQFLVHYLAHFLGRVKERGGNALAETMMQQFNLILSKSDLLPLFRLLMAGDAAAHPFPQTNIFLPQQRDNVMDVIEVDEVEESQEDDVSAEDSIEQ